MSYTPFFVVLLSISIWALFSFVLSFSCGYRIAVSSVSVATRSAHDDISDVPDDLLLRTRTLITFFFCPRCSY